MRILDITTDSIVARNTIGVNVEHLPCGPSVLPSGRSRDEPGAGLLAILKAFIFARLGVYDWVFLPPFHVGWTVDNSPLKVFIKRSIRLLTSSKLLCRIFRWIMFGKVKIALIDNSDQLSPSVSGIEMFSPQIYFMANSPKNLVKKLLPWGNGQALLLRIPMMMDDEMIEKFAASRANQERPYDVFITGYYHHPQREKQLAAAAILEARGRKVFELKERGFEKFAGGLASSKLCFAGQGLGYFSIRMGECVAAGAAPIINEPEAELEHGFIDGINAVVYSSSATPEQIADAVEAILDQPEQIPKIQEMAWRMISTENRLSALADKVISTMGSRQTLGNS